MHGLRSWQTIIIAPAHFRFSDLKIRNRLHRITAVDVFRIQDFLKDRKDMKS